MTTETHPLLEGLGTEMSDLKALTQWHNMGKRDLEIAQVSTSDHRILIQQIYDRRANKAHEVIGRVRDAHERGELQGDALVEVLDVCIASINEPHTTTAWHKDKEFGEMITPGEKVYIMDSEGLGVLCHVANDTDEKPVAVLRPKDTHPVGRFPSSRLAYRTMVINGAGEEHKVDLSPDSSVAGADNIIAHFKKRIVPDEPFHDHGFKELRQLDKAVSVMSALDEHDLSEEYRANGTKLALRLFGENNRSYVPSYIIGACIGFLHRHAPEKLGELYDGFAKKLAEKNIISRFEQTTPFLDDYLNAVQPDYNQLPIYAQNNALLALLNAMHQRGQEILLAQQAEIEEPAEV